VSQFLYRLGQFSARRAWFVIAGWVAIIGILGGIAATAGGTFSTAMTINGTDAQTTIETLESKFSDASRGIGQVVFHKTDGLPFTDEEKENITAALESVHDLPAVDDTVDPFDVQATLDENARDVADAPEKFADGQKKIDRGQAKIDKGLKDLAAARVDLANGRVELVANQKKLDKGLAKIQEAEPALRATKAEVTAAIAYYTSLGGHEAELDELNESLALINAGLATIVASKESIRDGQAKIDAAWADIYDGERQANDGDKDLARAQRKLDRGQVKLDEARDEFAFARIIMEGTTKFRVVSTDNQTATGSVMFTSPISDVETSDKEAVVAALSDTATENIQVEFSQDLTRSLGGLLGPGEIVGLLVAAIVLFVMLGTLVAAGLPVLSAIVGVAISGASSVALAAVVESTTTTPILGVMLGLAVGIDYSLFILNRHRRQLKAGMPVAESIALVDWRKGEAHFLQHLVDGDVAANNGGWQWSAGSGTDAQPYFRIFNPVTQAGNFDPDGAYVRRWIPELAALKAPAIHAPWAHAAALAAAGITLGVHYPEPIVDHAVARARTLEAYARAVKGLPAPRGE
jgi:RND superfamily putative drug exporter